MPIVGTNGPFAQTAQFFSPSSSGPYSLNFSDVKNDGASPIWEIFCGKTAYRLDDQTRKYSSIFHLGSQGPSRASSMLILLSADRSEAAEQDFPIPYLESAFVAVIDLCDLVENSRIEVEVK
jgi:hypothetical protein